jgi:hypothetical protein
MTTLEGLGCAYRISPVPPVVAFLPLIKAHHSTRDQRGVHWIGRDPPREGQAKRDPNIVRVEPEGLAGCGVEM